MTDSTITYSQPITGIIERRFSCRHYDPRPIEPGPRDQLTKMLAASSTGPLGTRMRFELVSAGEDDLAALRGLGTYGFIKGASGFIIGAVGPGENNMEDYAYLLERAVLFATDIGLGTCWLGGTFSKSGFSRKISLKETEILPAAVAVGYVADKPRWFDSYMRRRAGSDSRLPWSELFLTEPSAHLYQPTQPVPLPHRSKWCVWDHPRQTNSPGASSGTAHSGTSMYSARAAMQAKHDSLQPGRHAADRHGHCHVSLRTHPSGDGSARTVATRPAGHRET